MSYVEDLEKRVEELEEALALNMKNFRVPMPGDIVILKSPLGMDHSEVLTHNRPLIKVLKKAEKHILRTYDVDCANRIFSGIDTRVKYALPAETRMRLCSYDIKERRKKPNYDYVRFQLLKLPGVDWEYNKLYFRLKHHDILRMNAIAIELEE